MPNSRPGVCVCGFLLTWAGQRRSFRSLVSPISGADLQGQLAISQSTSGFTTRSSQLVEENILQNAICSVECPLSGFLLFRVPVGIKGC